MECGLYCEVPTFHLKIKWKCVVVCLQETSGVFQPLAASGPLGSLSLWHVIRLLKSCYSHANSELSLQDHIKQPACYLSHCKGSPLPLPARPLAFSLTLHFTPVSLGACCCPSSVPVRWNICALLMTQQPFLCLSIHLFLVVKLQSRADSRQAWFPFNSKAEGELCSLTGSHPHLLQLHCSNNKRETNWAGFMCQSSEGDTEVSGMKRAANPHGVHG